MASFMGKVIVSHFGGHQTHIYIYMYIYSDFLAEVMHQHQSHDPLCSPSQLQYVAIYGFSSEVCHEPLFGALVSVPPDGKSVGTWGMVYELGLQHGTAL